MEGSQEIVVLLAEYNLGYDRSICVVYIYTFYHGQTIIKLN